MKKLLILTALILFYLSAFSQRGFIEDSIRSPDGLDTTIYYIMWGDKWGLSVDYKDLDAADGVFNLGESGNSTDGSIFNQIDHSSLPYTMADSTQAFEKFSYNFKYLAIEFTRNSCSSGDYIRYWIFRDNKPTLVAMNSKPGEIEYLVDSARLYALKD